MSGVVQPELRRLRLRYPAVCATCGIALSAGADAVWNRSTKQATCLACAPADGIPEAGTAGASAASEGERRKARRVEEWRRRHGDHAAIVAAEMAARDTAATWGKGSDGERRLAAFVQRELGDRVLALHDRAVPGTRGNIDHLFVAETGVWVVDAKAYKGKLEQRERGPVWRRERQVYVGGRNRSSRAAGVEKQVAAVKAALAPDPVLAGTPLFGVLCFLDSEWGLLDFPFSVGTVWVAYPGALKRSLKRKGPLSRETMERIARRLDLSLPPAAG